MSIGSKFNILFTCAGRRVALINAFRQAMAELSLSGKIVATDQTIASAAYHCADLGVVMPPVSTIDYMPSLLKTCADQEIKLVIPTTDLDLRMLARHREKFTAMGCKVMIGSPDIIKLCRDKTLTAEFLQKIGLPAIRTLTLEQFRQAPFFPCFIKPVRGSASVGTGVLHSEPELHAHVSTFGDLMLVQDYVNGAEYTLDIYRTGAGEVKCVVPRQRLAIRSGEVEKGVTVQDKELIACCIRIGENLADLWGVINAQCRRPQGGKPQFFEINPRFGGGAPLAIAAGADLPRYVLEETLGLPVSAELGRFKPNLLMMRYDQALFVEVEDPSTLPGFTGPQTR